MENLKLKKEHILSEYEKLNILIKETLKKVCIGYNDNFILSYPISIDYIDSETFELYCYELHSIELINGILKFRLIDNNSEEIVIDFDNIKTESLIYIIENIL